MCFDIREFLGLDDAFDVKGLKKLLTVNTGNGLHTLTVRKPYCCHPRQIVYDALERYGVKVRNYNEHEVQMNTKDLARMMQIEFRTFENLKYGPLAVAFVPLCHEATVTVSAAQAGWAEYLLERTGRLAVVGGRVDARNRAWADKHNGRMPTPWADDTRQRLHEIDRQIQEGIARGQPWIESGCKSGQGVWQAVNKAIQNQQQEGKRNVQRKQQR